MVRTRWLATAALALALTWIPVRGADAQTRYWRSGFVFSVEPRLNFIPNTSIYYDRRASGYDLYRYGNRWYLVDQGNWYFSNDWRGPFVSVDYTSLPDEFVTLPDSYRRYWDSPTGVITLDAPEGAIVSARHFTRKPKMFTVGRGVTYARNADDFDLYRFRSTYYLVEDGIWYRSDSWRGPFFSIRASKAPREVLSVSTAYRRHWHADTGNRHYGDGRYQVTTRTYEPVHRFWRSSMTFDTQPEMRVIPNTSVYYLRDPSGYEVYRYANTWYVVDDGQWYSANTWRGPYVTIVSGSVPREIMTIPYAYRYYWSRTVD